MSSEPTQFQSDPPAAPAPGRPVIRVSGVGKRYRIWNDPTARLKSLAWDTLGSLTPSRSLLRQRCEARASTQGRDFEALREVSFEIPAGEAVAIIGRNGSGKSTLLQIIAGTLRPTTGEVEVRGKVAALLELGSAFHPQFSGRENVYLYCSILGLDSSRVDALFDEIAAFADIGDFMEQPVKTYSSGMMLRLAFSVQTAIAPEILIVDEALAVGDMFFQARCMRRIRRMLDDGTTLLFVSHAMSTVRETCSRGIMLAGGAVVFDGEVTQAAQRYISTQAGETSVGAKPGNSSAVTNEGVGAATNAAGTDRLRRAPAAEFPPTTVAPSAAAIDGPPPSVGKALFDVKAADERLSDGRASFYNVQMLGADRELSDGFSFDEAATLRMYVDVHEPVPYLWIGYHVRTIAGTDIVHVDTNVLDALDYPFAAGHRYRIDWRFPVRLQHGKYYIMCSISLPDPPRGMTSHWEYLDVVNHAFDFTVAARSEGLVGGYVVWHNQLDIAEVESA